MIPVRTLVPVFSAATLLVLTACASPSGDGIIRPGGIDDSTATAQPALPLVSSADVEFAQAMLPHHIQGVELAELALKTVTDPDVRAVAERIVASQSAERDFLERWLASLAPELQAGHEHHAMMGMLTARQMSDYASLRGLAARNQFLRLMQLHHEGAIQMANTRLTQTGDGTITSFARSVIVEQSSEIERMVELAQ
jgi:uncharacterized protein (DUF305 family)